MSGLCVMDQHAVSNEGDLGIGVAGDARVLPRVCGVMTARESGELGMVGGKA